MARNTEKDRAMAAWMREHGIVRTTARCPICNVVIALRSIYNHIAYHV